MYGIPSVSSLYKNVGLGGDTVADACITAAVGIGTGLKIGAEDYGDTSFKVVAGVGENDGY